jgi:sterol desaturase/sphingolipid hydroxylase (fatty acid hydroxylase superfamily)
MTQAHHASRASLATWFFLPALVAAVAFATWRLLQTDLPRPLASGLPMIAMVLVVLALERVFPLHRAWNRRPDGLDLLLLVVNRGVDVVILVGTAGLVAALGDAAGPASPAWPISWPLPLQVLLGITLAELARYAMHRYSHRPGFWWRVHRTHHEPERMYALNGPRLHPVNYLWVAAAHAVPMLVLGAPVETVLLVINVTAVFVIFQHANLDLRFDGLNRVLATPDVHRFHHARRGPTKGVNYAIVLLVLDRLFGTYAAPGPQPGADDVGLARSPDPRPMQ